MNLGSFGFSGGGGGGVMPTTPIFGSFYSKVTQTTIVNQPTAIQLDTADPWNNGISNFGSKIIFPTVGVYNLQFSAQMVKVAGNNFTHAHIWLNANGISVPFSASRIDFPSNSVYIVAAWNFFFEITQPNNYASLIWEINSNVNNAIEIQTAPASGNIPAIPSVIVTVNKVN